MNPNLNEHKSTLQTGFKFEEIQKNHMIIQEMKSTT